MRMPMRRYKKYCENRQAGRLDLDARKKGRHWNDFTKVLSTERTEDGACGRRRWFAWIFLHFSETDTLLAHIKDGVVLANEDITKNPHGMFGDIQTHEAQQTYRMSELSYLEESEEKREN